MNLNLPPKARQVAYAFTALGTPVVAYLQVKGIIGDAEAVLWAAEVTVVSALAAYNTTV
jgi:hypothetical protein